MKSIDASSTQCNIIDFFIVNQPIFNVTVLYFLSLVLSVQEYVTVAPSSKKRRLLTEHQEEVMKRRRSDLPTLYNALDPTLDSAPIVMDEPTQ